MGESKFELDFQDHVKEVMSAVFLYTVYRGETVTFLEYGLVSYGKYVINLDRRRL